MADQIHTTPELREVRFVRAVPPTPITWHQPLRGGRFRAISGRLLGETQFDGVLHHFRVEAGGVLFLVPPEWVRLTGETIKVGQVDPPGGRQPHVRPEVLA